MGTYNRTGLRYELQQRIGTTWSASDCNDFLRYGVGGVYPTFYLRKVNTTTAGTGPLQTKPTGATNLYMVGLKRPTSTRVRTLRNWTEGDTDAVVNKTGITGETLVWSWTEGWQLPDNDETTIVMPEEAKDYAILRAHIAALQKFMTTRIQSTDYMAVQVRQQVNEAEVMDSLDALYSEVRLIKENAVPLPEVVR